MFPSKIAVLVFLAILGCVGDCTPEPQQGFFPIPTLQIDDE